MLSWKHFQILKTMPTTPERDIGEISGKLDALIRQVELLDKKLDFSMKSIATIEVHEQRINDIEQWRGGLVSRIIAGGIFLFSVLTLGFQIIKEALT